jgi:diguanylate cyclase (GGDEF)-like protein
VTDRVEVLLVETEPSTRSLVRHGLALEGVETISAESRSQARVVIDEPFEAVLIDSDLLVGEGCSLVEELLERLPHSRIILHGLRGSYPGLPAVDKCDVEAILKLLDLDRNKEMASAAVTARQALGRVHRHWVELCRWDPMLPPGTRPQIAETVIRAISAALERPQPLGWGLDPALEPVAAAFGLNVGNVDTALAELVCLREAFARVVVHQLEDDQQVDALRRLQMIVDRTMLVVAQSGVRRLAEEALTDSLTGLGNRRAFDQDLRRELARVSRSHAELTVALLDVDGLKQVNDTLGHPAGDQLLRQLGNAIISATRAADRGYRIGGDEFALILADASGVEAEAMHKRLQAAGAPKFTIGIASLPEDDPNRLVELADARLYEQRRKT